MGYIAGWFILSIAVAGLNYCVCSASTPAGECRWAKIGARSLDRTA